MELLSGQLSPFMEMEEDSWGKHLWKWQATAYGNGIW
jgi:hypothetical protein